MRTQLVSEGELRGTHIGAAVLRAEACTFGPPNALVAFLTMTAGDGDVLNLSVRVTPTPDSPPAPNREGAGSGTVTGAQGGSREPPGRST
jgi:hypothetical protein